MAFAAPRRLRFALLLAVLLLPSAGGSRNAASPTYIWRDATGIVRFSTLSSR